MTVVVKLWNTANVLGVNTLNNPNPINEVFTHTVVFKFLPNCFCNCAEISSKTRIPDHVSSKNTISLACLAISDELAITTPTFAFERAAESFRPSPIIKTRCPLSCKS